MNRTQAFAIPATLALLAAGACLPVSAYTGDDPVIVAGPAGIAACQFDEIRARIGPDNTVTYKIYGNCQGSAISGELTFQAGEFYESFTVSNREKIDTHGYCETDPWATAINCHDQTISAVGMNVEPNLEGRAPLSLIGDSSPKLFHDAFNNATRPNPPGMPVNFSATEGIGQMTARWIAPDDSGDRPFLGFLVQVQPHGATGGKWTDFGRIGRHTRPEYLLPGKLPPSSSTVRDWDARVCAVTQLAQTCTPALFPGSIVREVAETKSDHNAAALFQPAPTVAFARVKTDTAGPTMTICEAAASARARNSPAAPGLEKQCAAQPAKPIVPVMDEAWRAKNAARGEELVNLDPMALAVRNQWKNAEKVRAFNIGMAVAEGQTAPGPGKQAIHDVLTEIEQRPFEMAVWYSIDRNANAKLAEAGAAMAKVDPTIAEARTGMSDPFYWLGFDIASGLFGDPALGSVGNTAMGPGSVKIRDALNPADAREGFNDGVKFHLARKY